MASLSSIPRELLDDIISQPRLSKYDLCQLSLVCRDFYRITKPHIWKGSFDLDPYGSQITLLLRSLLEDTSLGNKIDSLTIDWSVTALRHPTPANDPSREVTDKAWEPWSEQSLLKLEETCNKYNFADDFRKGILLGALDPTVFVLPMCSMMPHFESLKLIEPRSCWPPAALMHYLENRKDDISQIPEADPSFSDVLPAFSNLKSLERSDSGRPNGYLRWEHLIPIMLLPKLESFTVDIYHGIHYVGPFFGQQGYIYGSNIKRIDFSICICPAEDVADVIYWLANLEDVKIAVEQPFWDGCVIEDSEFREETVKYYEIWPVRTALIEHHSGSLKCAVLKGLESGWRWNYKKTEAGVESMFEKDIAQKYGY